ncbi:MAG: Lar family restriction alleviation protein [Lachnospiraceae bacterium]|nr:Lar family restriction alleviation protein [Lachnospiraceae bacterium]
MADLKSCPFCGGEAEIWEDKVFCTYVPQCKECNAQRGRYINKENAIKAWNTRKPMEAVVAELEKRANDNDRAADRLSGIESKKKITSWRARAEALRDAAEIVRGKE